MSNVFSENYYRECCGEDYSNKDHWQAFFGNIAQAIVRDFSPETVLDAGCAWGYLVEALRDLGVEAFGIDVSQYAIDMVREDVRPFCAVADLSKDLPEHFPQRFDLVTSIEVLEHMREEPSLEALKNLCEYSDKIIFSSSPDDITEETHYNVQQIEYWSKKFAQHGFIRNLIYAPDYIAPWAFLVEKEDEISKSNIVEDYERQLRISKHWLNQRIGELHNYQNMLEQRTGELSNCQSVLEQRTGELNNCQSLLEQNKSELSNYKSLLDQRTGELNDCQSMLEQRTNEYKQSQMEIDNQNHYISEYHLAIQQREHYLSLYSAMQHSTFWRITKPARVVVGGLKRFLRQFPLTRLPYKALSSLRHTGVKATMVRVRLYMNRKKQYATSFKLSSSERVSQERHKFNKDIKISVIVPLYNTPEDFLREMIESVKAQTYANWELCMADGSDKEHSYVGSICKTLAKKDKRIKYKKLDKNGGISYNTNQAIEIATGEYIGLLDHDDLLHPSLLFEVMQAIESHKADMIYTDEMTFEGNPSNAITLHFKPDFALDNLRANNYICHFSCFSKKLLDEVGWFRTECDGSQDYDIILRLTEKAKTIVHIPKLLYFWRSHAGSVARDVSVKSYCIDAAKLAISNHLERCGLSGKVVDAPNLTSIYKIEYILEARPLVSIIIPNKDSKQYLEMCIDSIRNTSTYANWEILIVENNSELPETFEYYKEVEQDERISVITWRGVFNYSAINNYAAGYANGEYLLFLNNDTEVISPKWLEEMLMYAQRQDVGAVGAKLYFSNDTIQHAGVVVGLGGAAGHVFYTADRRSIGYMGRIHYTQNYSAVTAACMMVSKALFEEVHGFDEELAVAYNDVDFCLKLRKIGQLNVFTPFAELYHKESLSRGSDQTGNNMMRWKRESDLFTSKWQSLIDSGDPYFNPNLYSHGSDIYISSAK